MISWLLSLGYSRTDITESLLLAELCCHVRNQFDKNEELKKMTTGSGTPEPKKVTASVNNPMLQRIMKNGH